MRVAERLAELLAVDHFDQAAQHVGRHAVFPARAGRELQRQGGELGDEFLVAHAAIADLGVDVGLVDQRRAARAVGEARRVAQQILHGHGALGIAELQHRPAVDDFLGADLHLADLGQELRHGIADLEPALLDHLHDRDADDRLGHGVDAEDRVGLHRIARRHVAFAERRHPGDLAAPRHQHDRARHQAGVDVLLRHLLEALQLRGRETDILRLARHGQHAVLGMRRRRHGQQSQRKHRLFHGRPPGKASHYSTVRPAAPLQKGAVTLEQLDQRVHDRPHPRQGPEVAMDQQPLLGRDLRRARRRRGAAPGPGRRDSRAARQGPTRRAPHRAGPASC